MKLKRQATPESESPLLKHRSKFSSKSSEMHCPGVRGEQLRLQRYKFKQFNAIGGIPPTASEAKNEKEFQTPSGESRKQTINAVRTRIQSF